VALAAELVHHQTCQRKDFQAAKDHQERWFVVVAQRLDQQLQRSRRCCLKMPAEMQGKDSWRLMASLLLTVEKETKIFDECLECEKVFFFWKFVKKPCTDSLLLPLQPTLALSNSRRCHCCAIRISPTTLLYQMMS
jgi:hypothetical protein